MKKTIQILLYKYSEDLATAAKVSYIFNAIIPIMSTDKWDLRHEEVLCRFTNISYPFNRQNKKVPSY